MRVRVHHVMKEIQREHFLVSNIFLQIKKMFPAAMKYFPYMKENITVMKMLSLSISQRTCHKELCNVQNVTSGFQILRGWFLSRIFEDRNTLTAGASDPRG